VRYAAINPLDWKLVEGEYRLLMKSKPPAGVGCEFSGTVEALGSGVAAPAIGTAVVGYIDPSARPPGALQQFVVASAREVQTVDAADLEAACTLPVAGISALQMCRLAEVKSGQRVLVHGAAGGVGSFAVQVAKMLGGRVTATSSRANQAVLEALGVEARIDYTTQKVATWGGPFNAVLDCSSTLGAADIGTLLSSGGHYVRTLPAMPSLLLDPLLNALRPVKKHTLRLKANADDLRTLLAWLRRGRIRPLITQRFAFADAVAALELSKSGREHGKLVVQVA